MALRSLARLRPSHRGRWLPGSGLQPPEDDPLPACGDVAQGKPELHRVDRPTLLPCRPNLLIGGCLVALCVIAALLAPILTAHPPNAIGTGGSLEAPSAAHPCGTDVLGRDMFARVLYGARAALALAALAVGLAAGMGILTGLIAGYYGRRIDQVLARVMEVWMAFPGLLLALIVVARLGPSLVHAALALGIVSAPGFFRLARSATLCAKQAGYVEAARSIGAPDPHVILRHILPNIAPSLIVLVTMRMGAMILAAGSLSFVGLGVQPPQAEWGALLANAREYMGEAPWLALYPGLAVTATVIGLNLLGDGLRDILTRTVTQFHVTRYFGAHTTSK